MAITQSVVLDTTKVQIFKQITTKNGVNPRRLLLFQIPQRYRFSSKSQHKNCSTKLTVSCFRYHKGTDFQANHNKYTSDRILLTVVLDTTKVQIFKQITTVVKVIGKMLLLFQIPQRYRFSSKSQHVRACECLRMRCFRYHKGTDFQANHNKGLGYSLDPLVVLDTTKVQIFKQITTNVWFSSLLDCCFRYHKGTDFQANHNDAVCGVSTQSVVLDTTKVQIFKQITTSPL